MLSRKRVEREQHVAVLPCALIGFLVPSLFGEENEQSPASRGHDVVGRALALTGRTVRRLSSRSSVFHCLVSLLIAFAITLAPLTASAQEREPRGLFGARNWTLEATGQLLERVKPILS